MGDLTTLNTEERQELAACEAIIERGLKTFYEVGAALATIRDLKLYRQSHGTFESYCQDRWDFSGERARLLMRGAEVMENLQETPTIVGVLPANEAQIRPLSQLEPQQQVMAWQRAVETAPEGKVTAAHVERVVEEFRAPVLPQFVAGPEKPFPSGTILPEGHPTTYQTVRVNPGLFSSATPEWYTPQHIIDRVLKLFGRIDLDPCSNSHTAPNVPAVLHYTKDDDGLNRFWSGLVYMNPPYGDEIGDWVETLVASFEQGDVDAAVALLPARVDTAWFQHLRDCTICFIRGRLKFSGAENSAPFPSVVVYLGDDPEAFGECFGDLGDIWGRLATSHDEARSEDRRRAA